MKHLRRFTGAVLGLFIGFFDLVAILGMPWEPDLSSSRDRWIVATIGLFGLLGSFWAGWLQRGQDLSADADEKDALLCQKDDQIAKLDGELSAIKSSLQSLLDEQRDREREEREREEARRAAIALSPANKLLLMELSKGLLLTISIDRYDLLDRIVDLYGLVEHTEVGFGVQELWISDYGMWVVELAGDILSKVRPNAVYPWWQSGRFSSDEQRVLGPQEESHQESLRNWPHPISADDVETIS